MNPGVRCGKIKVNGDNRLVLNPGEHYFVDTDIEVVGKGQIVGTDVGQIELVADTAGLAEQFSATILYALLGSAAALRLAAEIALSHHERWDGGGYPHGIAGDRIPLSGRITAVADVCDALLSERPYKEPWPVARVRDFLVAETGTHFDPACVEAILDRWAELEAVYSSPAPAREAA